MPAPVNLARATPVDGWLSRLGRTLWAPRCLVCREPAGGQLDLCARCAAGLPWMPPACLSCAMPLPLPLPLALPPSSSSAGVLPGRLCGACQHDPPPLAEVHAAFLYGFPLDRLLPRLKFHRDLAAGRLLAQAMAAAVPRARGPTRWRRCRCTARGCPARLQPGAGAARRWAACWESGAGGLLVRSRATGHSRAWSDAARHQPA